MTTRGDPSVTGEKGIHLRVGIDGPLGSGEPQGAVLFSAPVDVPQEQPSTVELGIILKSSIALGLTIPRSLPLRADEVTQ